MSNEAKSDELMFEFLTDVEEKTYKSGENVIPASTDTDIAKVSLKKNSTKIIENSTDKKRLVWLQYFRGRMVESF